MAIVNTAYPMRTVSSTTIGPVMLGRISRVITNSPDSPRSLADMT